MSLFSKDHGELSIIFDIGSQNIGVAIVIQKNTDTPQIIWTHRENFSDEKTKSSRELLEAMLSTLKKINETLQKDAVADLRIKGFALSKAIYCVLSSPWVDTEQKTITRAFQTPTMITQKLVQDILAKEETSFGTSLKDQTGFAEIEKTISGFKVNGYSIKNPYNKKASSLDISFALAITPQEIADRIEECLSAKKAKMAASGTQIHTALQELFGEKDFLAIIIEDALTEISIVREGILSLHTSFPTGTNALTVAVSKAFAVSFAEAESLIDMSLRKEIDTATADTVASFIKSEGNAWCRAFKTAMETLSQENTLPSKAFFVAPESGTGFITHIAKSRSTDMPLLESIIVNEAVLKNKIIFGHASHADVRLGLLAIAAHTAQAEK